MGGLPAQDMPVASGQVPANVSLSEPVDTMREGGVGTARWVAGSLAARTPRGGRSADWRRDHRGEMMNGWPYISRVRVMRYSFIFGLLSLAFAALYVVLVSRR